MEPELFKTLGQVAGIGGIVLGITFLLFRDVIRSSIFPKLEPHAAYKLLRLLTVAVWSIGVVGLLVWAYPPGAGSEDAHKANIEAIGGVAGGGDVEGIRIDIRGPLPAVPQPVEQESPGGSIRAVGGVAAGQDISDTTITIDGAPTPPPQGKVPQ